MAGGGLHAALREAVGSGAFEEHAPIRVDGLEIGASLVPGAPEELVGVLGVLARHAAPVLLRGGGSRLGLGHPPRDAKLLLSTSRLAGILELDGGEGVCRALAGTPLAVLREKAAAAGWELPLDPPGGGSTLGGTLASAALGPRALGLGLPRDAVLGLDVVLAGGERTRCGGRVVKNVTGYDLGKLYVGSLGTLGVIESAWLRLRPRPERVVVLRTALPDLARACEAGRAGARRGSARAACVVATPPAEGGAAELVVELAGDARAVARDAEWGADAWGLAEADPAELERVRELQGERPGPGGLRFRVAAVSSQLSRAGGRLREAGARLLLQPGLGLLFAGFAGGSAGVVADAWRAVAEAARLGEGGWLLEDAPPTQRRGRDLFGPDAGSRALMRALKQRFDPAGLLNPGRIDGAA